LLQLEMALQLRFGTMWQVLGRMLFLAAEKAMSF